MNWHATLRLCTSITVSYTHLDVYKRQGQSWKLRLMNTIDACMKYAADKDAFVSLMASEGYAVRWESSRKMCIRDRWRTAPGRP